MITNFLSQPKDNLQKILSHLENSKEIGDSNSHIYDRSHIKNLSILLKEVPFFKNSFTKSEDLLNFIRYSSNNFHYEFFSKGSIIFHIGDQADKFYLILSGKIGVFVPQNSLERKSARMEIQHSPLTTLKIPDIIYESHFRNSCSQEIKKKYFEEDLFIFKMIKTLTEKDCFGESALSTNKPRFATILAIKDLKVLTLLKEDFERGFSKINQESQTKLDFFKKLFERNQNEFSSNLLMRFIYYFHEQELAPNKIIFNQWDIPNDFFVIISGEIEISQHIINQQIVESKPLFSVNEALKKSRMMFNIAKLGSFNLLGEDDIIEEKKKRSYTATTTSHVKLYVISKQKFLHMIKSFPQIFEMFKELYASKNSWREKRMKNLVETAKITDNFFKIDSLRQKTNQSYFPWSKNKTEKKDFVIRKEEKIDGNADNSEEIRISKRNLDQYLDQKSYLFEKLNQYPFNSKIKKTIFYFPKEKLKTKQILDQNFLSLRRFSEENTPNNKILTSNLFLRSSSKPNILSSNIKEKKINYTTFIKSQRYVNSIRPFTIIKLKEMNKKLTTSLNSLGNEFASSNRYEEDAYQIKEIYNERNKHKGKVWKNLNTIVKSK